MITAIVRPTLEYETVVLNLHPRKMEKKIKNYQESSRKIGCSSEKSQL